MAARHGGAALSVGIWFRKLWGHVGMREGQAGQGAGEPETWKKCG